MVFIVSILAISTLVGFCMYENFGTDTKKIMDIMSVEVGDAYASDKSGKVDYEVFIRELESVPSVKCALADSSYSFQVINGNLKQMVSTTAYDDTSKLQAVNLVEGRLPETDNELTNTLKNDIYDINTPKNNNNTNKFKYLFDSILSKFQRNKFN